MSNHLLKEVKAKVGNNNNESFTSKERFVSIVEEALGTKLYPWQVDYIFPHRDLCIPAIHGKRPGKTLAYCIRLALILDILNRELDVIFIAPDTCQSSKLSDHFKRTFLDVRHKLKVAGLPVRELPRGERY